MKVVYNRFIPFKGFMALTIWPFVFVRKAYASQFGAVDKNHESIHGEQQKEMLIVLFFLLYLTEYLVRIFIYRNLHEAYRNVSFEREAYLNAENFKYIENRKHFARTKYIFKS